jgi:hypothetical protein
VPDVSPKALLWKRRPLIPLLILGLVLVSQVARYVNPGVALTIFQVCSVLILLLIVALVCSLVSALVQGPSPVDVSPPPWWRSRRLWNRAGLLAASLPFALVVSVVALGHASVHRPGASVAQTVLGGTALAVVAWASFVAFGHVLRRLADDSRLAAEVQRLTLEDEAAVSQGRRAVRLFQVLVILIVLLSLAGASQRHLHSLPIFLILSGAYFLLFWGALWLFSPVIIVVVARSLGSFRRLSRTD